jgi:hypothetical protein
MATRHRKDGSEAKIIQLFAGDDQAKVADLARYWDATVQGQPADRGSLDPQLTTVVQLLRHYHGMPQCHREAPTTIRPAPHCLPADQPNGALHLPICSGDRAGWHDPARSMRRMGVGLTAIFLVAFVVNTVTSPRSWLSTTSDPDWIPWVSDDWINSVWDGV